MSILVSLFSIVIALISIEYSLQISNCDSIIKNFNLCIIENNLVLQYYSNPYLKKDDIEQETITYFSNNIFKTIKKYKVLFTYYDSNKTQTLAIDPVGVQIQLRAETILLNEYRNSITYFIVEQ